MTDQFRNLTEQLMQRYGLPGLAIGVARDGQPVYREGFGYRDVEQQLPISTDTIVGAGSLTKSLTCVAILQLQEVGKLRVTDPVVRYLPSFGVCDPTVTGQITLHHMMTHTTGIPTLPALLAAIVRSAIGDPYIPPGIDLSQVPPIDTTEHLTEFLKAFPYELFGAPGELFSYNDLMYGLLGSIIAEVSGQPYREYVQEHIMTPAGMSRSTFADPSDLPDVTTQYAWFPNPDGPVVIPAPRWWNGGVITAAGFLRTTVDDYLRYAHMFCTGGVAASGEHILSEESVAAMTTPHVQVHQEMSYGYGLSMRRHHGMNVLEHGGSVKGVSAQMIAIPDRGITAVALGNMQGVPVGLPLLRAVNDVLGLPTDTRWSTYTPVATDLTPYVGAYTSLEGVTLTVTANGDSLAVVASGLGYLEEKVVHVGGHRFMRRGPDDDVVMSFLTDEAGRIWGLRQGLRILRRI